MYNINTNFYVRHSACKKNVTKTGSVEYVCLMAPITMFPFMIVVCRLRI